MAVVGGEDASEDGVDVGELALEVEGLGEFLRGKTGGDGRVGSYAVAEGRAIVCGPGRHGVLLDEAVGVFAGHVGFGELEQELAGEDQAAS